MASERLQYKGLRLVFLTLGIISFTGAGYQLASSKYLSSALLTIVGIVFIWIILRIYEEVNKAITFFFDSLRNDDTTLNFPTITGNKSLNRLYDSMNLLNIHFQEIRLRNEYNETYYKTIIQNASAGLLVINDNKQIELINRTACRYAGISPDSGNYDQLRIKHPAFYEAICDLKPGENVTYRNRLSDNLQILMFKAIMIRKKDAVLKLVSIQDIRYELESREMESYRKLISVMTHEIMNLLTPLTTVAKELYTKLFQNDRLIHTTQIDEGIIKSTVNGLMLIDEQSNGLLNFINNYRRISRLPQPEFTTINMEEWIGQLKIVFDSKMRENQISFSIGTDKSLKQISADKNLLNQVVINLINNSFDAVMEIDTNRIIEIQVMKTLHEKVIIKISNNGPLIPQKLQEKIFVPFFTTKKNGSGIGLSISQEIMKLHNGSLVVISSPENQTSFIIEF